MLEVDGLTRRFGDTVAVDEVNFDVPAGRMTGFVGGNGAGKTTTMRMIMGVLGPTAGSVRWRGHDVTTADRRTFGYMPEERGLYPKQPVLDQLIYLGRLQGRDAAGARRTAIELLGSFGLGDRTGDKLESLSLGNQQRVQIVAAVIGEPELLVLDEPFSGLDPVAVDSMVDLLREHTARGVSVLFSSHQLDLVERICDRLVILSSGRVRATGTVDALRRRDGTHHRLVLGADASWIRGLPGVDVLEVSGHEAQLRLHDPDGTDRLLREALDRGTVRELIEIVPSLSDVFREVTA